MIQDIRYWTCSNKKTRDHQLGSGKKLGMTLVITGQGQLGTISSRPNRSRNDFGQKIKVGTKLIIRIIHVP